MSFLQPFLSPSSSPSFTVSSSRASSQRAPRVLRAVELAQTDLSNLIAPGHHVPRGTFGAARISARSPVGAWIFELRRPAGEPVIKLPKGVR
jgi:hypothetical protein